MAVRVRCAREGRKAHHHRPAVHRVGHALRRLRSRPAGHRRRAHAGHGQSYYRERLDGRRVHAKQHGVSVLGEGGRHVPSHERSGHACHRGSGGSSHGQAHRDRSGCGVGRGCRRTCDRRCRAEARHRRIVRGAGFRRETGLPSCQGEHFRIHRREGCGHLRSPEGADRGTGPRVCHRRPRVRHDVPGTRTPCELPSQLQEPRVPRGSDRQRRQAGRFHLRQPIDGHGGLQRESLHVGNSRCQLLRHVPPEGHGGEKVGGAGSRDPRSVVLQRQHAVLRVGPSRPHRRGQEDRLRGVRRRQHDRHCAVGRHPFAGAPFVRGAGFRPGVLGAVSHVHPESARPSVRMQDRSGDHASGDREDGHGHLPEIGR